MKTTIPKQEQQIEYLIRSIGSQETPEFVTRSLLQKINGLKNSKSQTKTPLFVGYLSNLLIIPFTQFRYAASTICMLCILTALLIFLPHLNQNTIAFADVLNHFHNTTGFTITQSSRLTDGSVMSLQDKQEQIDRIGLTNDINVITEKLRTLRDGSETYLGSKNIGGIDTVGFEMTKDGVHYIIWADPKTALPYQAEIVYPLPDNNEWSLTLNQFSYDSAAPFAMNHSVSASSTRPGESQSSFHTQSIHKTTDSIRSSGSAGGAASGGSANGGSSMGGNSSGGTFDGGGSGGSVSFGSTIHGVTTRQWSSSIGGGGGGAGFGFGQDSRARITEEQLIESLQEWVTQNNGVFPDTLNRGQAFQMYFQSNDIKNATFDSNLKKFLNKIGPAVTFTRQYRRLGWHYNGAGIKRGEIKPVCWWKPKNSNTYKVLYGDFTVRDVQPENVPSIKSDQ